MKKTNILLVDDYRENIAALSGLIESDDIQIYSATNADEALELLTRHDFGLALLDVQMPGVSGLELARLIRGVKKFRHLPIIFVTAHHEHNNLIFESYGTGAVDLLFKPLDPHVVRNKVRVFVELSQQRVLLQEHVEELERLRLEADAANIAKSQFLANMSHEIRTPLAAVMGFAELIAKGFASEKEKDDSVAAVKRNGDLLLRLIDDILDLSRIEANRLELEHLELELGEIFEDVNSTLSFKARDKGIVLNFNWDQKALGYYFGDPLRIKQVLLNVVGNAIKFTSKGSVDVETAIAPTPGASEKDYSLVKVTVTDHGIGLTEEQAENLFQPFGQADPSTRRHFGGSGLGLVISRQILRAMGGDLTLVRSVHGKGSTFEIKFQLENIPPSEATLSAKKASNKTREVNADFHGKRVLAVDDSADNLTLIELYLRNTGAELTFADSGTRALSLAAAKTFDLILMDIQMPGMDGHETTEELRRRGFKGPIIAFTAHAIKSEHDKCRESGCDGVLTKPLTGSVLVENIAKFLNI